MGAREAVAAMNGSREQTVLVVDQASRAGSSLENIAASVAEIDETSAQIAASTEGQKLASENMKNNADRITLMASKNATGADQGTQSGQDLANMAVQLQNLVGQFRV